LDSIYSSEFIVVVLLI